VHRSCKKLLDFCGNLDHVMLGLGLGLQLDKSYHVSLCHFVGLWLHSSAFDFGLWLTLTELKGTVGLWQRCAEC